MFNSFLGMSSGGGSGGGGDTLPTAGNGVTFDDVEAAADFTNQLGPPSAVSVRQTQREQGIPLPPAVPVLGVPLPPAALAVGGGMNPPPPPPQQAGAAGLGGANSPPGMRHTPASTPSFKNWGTQCMTRQPSRPSSPCSSGEPLATWQIGRRSAVLWSMFQQFRYSILSTTSTYQGKVLAFMGTVEP